MLMRYDWARLANEAKVGRYETPLYTNEEMDIIRNGLDPICIRILTGET